MSAAVADVVDVDLDLTAEVPCEGRPWRHSCGKIATWSVTIAPHGCRRDHRQLAFCGGCYKTLMGGGLCGECNSRDPVFIISARKL